MNIFPHKVLVQMICYQGVFGLSWAIVYQIVTFPFVKRPVGYNEFVFFPQWRCPWCLGIGLEFRPQDKVTDHKIALASSLAKVQTFNLCCRYHI